MSSRGAAVDESLPAALVILVVGRLDLPALDIAPDRRIHVRRTTQQQQPAQHDAEQDCEDHDRAPHQLPRAMSRISPSCAVLAISLPSRVKILPRLKPRAPEALGLSVE